MCTVGTLLDVFLNSNPKDGGISLLTDFGLRLRDWLPSSNEGNATQAATSAVLRAAQRIVHDMSLALRNEPSQLSFQVYEDATAVSLKTSDHKFGVTDKPQRRAGTGLTDWLGAAVAINTALSNPSSTQVIDEYLIFAGCRDDCGLFVPYLKHRASLIRPPFVSTQSIDFTLASTWALNLTKELQSSLLNTIPELDSSNTIRDFLEYVRLKQPVIIRGYFTPPSAEQLSAIFASNAHRWVPVEIGCYYTRSNWAADIMPLNRFVDALLCGACEDLYLAQYPVLYQFPELENLLPSPSLLRTLENYRLDPASTAVQLDLELPLKNDDTNPVLDSGAIPIRNCWLGPPGKITPHHQDTYENLYTQVCGTKYFQLIDERWTPLMKPFSKIMRNTSQISPSIFLEKMGECCLDGSQELLSSPPSVLTGEGMLKQNARHVILQSGDCLYVPKQMWHLVVGLTTNFGVSNWIN
eukprot:Protomagalhaensia_sp_Gyna_25__4696@NODE_44_length_6376_cov_50_956288_g33_i0_p2_GENE_NODE_44_length_6376_cov_50_956288_g33_i0NODE_44_length_6376_cov_50_956288_g33_i0_p2_ORF_typecomplete_len467_score58_59Cupin_8/PF13621_6/2_8e30Cupin_4/PF08007_12/5_2e03Cupin_4/PF08007_12/9_8e07Cupin_2/PF07883_11/1_8e02Cupin_2/PF07883_11/0_025_NODE_44_length_6376_cov_50_956288_g33_i025223922